MSDLTQQFKEYAQQAEADLIGIAGRDRFEDWAPEVSPLSIAPDLKSVITVGRRITRGSLRGTEEGTNFNTFQRFGYTWLETEFLAMTTFECVEFLEDNGWEAVPLFGFPPEAYPQGVPVRDGSPAPNIYPNFADVAVACGLGTIGINGSLLTPEYGPRQRLQLILSDAPLTPDPVHEGDICQRCMACAEACPLDAVDANNLQELTIAGRTMQIAGIDYEKCRECENGACPNAYHPSGLPDRLGAVCNRTCVDALEAKDAVENTFENPFRIREAWGINQVGELVDIPAEPMNLQGEGEGR
ncbi:MAG: hypothetical protein ACLFWB_04200 [Armatimonadota bacterium]